MCIPPWGKARNLSWNFRRMNRRGVAVANVMMLGQKQFIKVFFGILHRIYIWLPVCAAPDCSVCQTAVQKFWPAGSAVLYYFCSSDDWTFSETCSQEERTGVFVISCGTLQSPERNGNPRRRVRAALRSFVRQHITCSAASCRSGFPIAIL